MSRHWYFPQGTSGCLFAAALMIVAAYSATAAPKSELWPRWEAHDPNSNSVIDHGRWQRFIANYLVSDEDGVNRLHYGRVSAASRRELEVYLETLTAIPISEFRRTEQLAYWINLYNALAVEVVLGRYPVASILEIDISPGWFSNGPWQKKLITVEGQELIVSQGVV